MSREGSLARIERYKINGQTEFQAFEEKFFEEHYGDKKPIVEKTKKSK